MESKQNYWIVSCLFCQKRLGIVEADSVNGAVSILRPRIKNHVNHLFGAIASEVPSHNVENLGCVVFPHIAMPPKRHDK